MKTRILSLALPIAAFTLASAGAVSTKIADTKASESGAVPGWTRNGQNHCLTQVQCKETIGAFCTDGGGARAYAMSAPNQCTIDLFKLP